MRHDASFAVVVENQSGLRRAREDHAFGSIVTHMTAVLGVRAELLIATTSFVRAVKTIGQTVAQLGRFDTVGLIVAQTRRLKTSWSLHIFQMEKLI